MAVLGLRCLAGYGGDGFVAIIDHWINKIDAK
jgi:hypothetical protein